MSFFDEMSSYFRLKTSFVSMLVSWVGSIELDYCSFVEFVGRFFTLFVEARFLHVY